MEVPLLFTAIFFAIGILISLPGIVDGGTTTNMAIEMKNVQTQLAQCSTLLTQRSTEMENVQTQLAQITIEMKNAERQLVQRYTEIKNVQTQLTECSQQLADVRRLYKGENLARKKKKPQKPQKLPGICKKFRCRKKCKKCKKKACKKWCKKKACKKCCKNCQGNTAASKTTEVPTTTIQVTTVAPRTTEDPTTTSQGCWSPTYQNLTNTNIGTIITSPGFENNKNYSSDTFCDWTFSAPPGHKVSLTVLSIDTEYGYDVMRVFDGVNDEEGKAKMVVSMSGSKDQDSLISSKEVMRVIFTSDGSINHKGFKATVIAVKKTDLPSFSWNGTLNLNITFHNETQNSDKIINIRLNLVPEMLPACIYEGIVNGTSVTIASSSSYDNCQSLDQHVEISVKSPFLKNRKATYSLRNGQLTEITEPIFTDTVKRRKKGSTGKLSTKMIEIFIMFGYDKSILQKFQKYGSGHKQIEKQLKELFYFAKQALNLISVNTKIELLLVSEIKYIDEFLNVSNSHLERSRKYQVDETVPIVIVCADDYTSATKGLAFRSGACREGKERYGVALVAWREDTALAGEVLAHEIAHLLGMAHDEGRVDSEGGYCHLNETEEGGEWSDCNEQNIDTWYATSGRRCYDQSCPLPPIKQNGNWSCDAENKNCNLKCHIGYVTVFSTIKCENGNWSKTINDIACDQSVFLLAGGYGDLNNVEIYHPTIGKPMCSNIPPSLDHAWRYHTTFIHQETIYLCGGFDTRSICNSINGEQTQWKTHTMPAKSGLSAVVIHNTVYFIGGSSSDGKLSEVISTKLPLTDKPEFSPVPNLPYKGQFQCVVKLNKDSFVITGGYDYSQYHKTPSLYYVTNQTRMDLSPLQQPRGSHGCVLMEEAGKEWIVVAGGSNSRGWVKTTEILELSGSGQWELIGKLTEARRGHGMVVTESGIVVMGGFKYLNTVELLDWTTKQWQMVEPSITSGRSYFGGAVEIPASRFNCQLNIITECPAPPNKRHGTWICDAGYTTCFLKCAPGFVSVNKTTACSGGRWDQINKFQCLPSVFLLLSGKAGEVYHPTRVNLTCPKPLPPLDHDWKYHTTFTHHEDIYLCGGFDTSSICNSINGQQTQWKIHKMSPRYRHSSVVIHNTVYFIGGSTGTDYTAAVSTTLPLTDKLKFTPVSNLPYKGDYPCVIKISDDSFVITGGYYYPNYLANVIQYHVINQTNMELSALEQPRSQHGCVMMEIDGNHWFVVTGGWDNGVLQTTETFDLNGIKQWNLIGDLIVARCGHSMIETERGLMVMGGNPDWYSYNYFKSVELLDWTKKEWQLVEPRLTTERSFFGGAVELPALLFDCETTPVNIKGCEGDYQYNKAYVDGEKVDITQNMTSPQSCHDQCHGDQNCETWTWMKNGNGKCHLFKSNDQSSTQTEIGSISGIKSACKPKCYLITGHLDATTNTQFCNETDCYNIIHMEPTEFEEEDKILICYSVSGSDKCQPINYSDVALMCNPEPSIVTSTIWSRINKRRFTSDNYVSWYWR